MPNDNDVDLEAMLSESGQDDGSGASAPKDTTQSDSKVVKPSESERENERIRVLVEENNTLKTQLADKSKPAESSGNDKSVAQPTDLDSLLETKVADPGSREVLRSIAQLLEKNIESKYAPKMSEVEQERNERQFDSLAGKIPALAPFKTEVLKSLQNKPGTSLKSLVGEILIDKQLSKIKPTETQGSNVSREAPDLDSMELEDLYELLGAK